MILRLALAVFFAFALPAKIVKLDEEDLRDLRAFDPLTLLSLPPMYAFSQAAQSSVENGYRYFAFVYYECTFGPYKTNAHFEPPSNEGILLEYVDEWIRIEYYGYFDPPDSPDVFDVESYAIEFGDGPSGSSDGSEEEEE